MCYRIPVVHGVALAAVLIAGFSWNACSRQERATTAEAIEHQVRVALPIGTTLSTAQHYFRGSGVPNGFDSHSNKLSAVWRDVAGSNPVVRRNLSLQLQFDASLHLTGIGAKVWLTGP